MVGDWSVEKSVGQDGNTGLYVLDGEDICNLYYKTPDGDIIQFPNAEYHAKLIAAAPDMLELVVALSKMGSLRPCNIFTILKAKALVNSLNTLS